VAQGGITPRLPAICQRCGEIIVAESVQRDQHAHRRILQQPVKLVRRRPRAERDHDATGNLRPEERFQPFRAGGC
jgi:hypothetical protein